MPIHKFLFRNCGGSALHLSDDMQLFGISGSYFCGKVKVVCMVCWGLLLAFWKSFYSFVLNKRYSQKKKGQISVSFKEHCFLQR